MMHLMDFAQQLAQFFYQKLYLHEQFLKRKVCNVGLNYHFKFKSPRTVRITECFIIFFNI